MNGIPKAGASWNRSSGDCTRYMRAVDAIFDRAVLLREVGMTSSAGIARNQDAGVNMNTRESFSIAACSSFGRAAIWS
jgi:hypothetical protein